MPVRDQTLKKPGFLILFVKGYASMSLQCLWKARKKLSFIAEFTKVKQQYLTYFVEFHRNFKDGFLRK